MPPTPPFIVLDVPLEIENAKGELEPVTPETLRGNTIWPCEGEPEPLLGIEGDWALDHLNARLYGPKTGAGWPKTFLSLVGPEGKLGPESVTTETLHGEAVTAAKLAPAAVETSKIKDGAVTEPKIAESAVTTSRLAAGAVVAAKLGAEAVETAAIKAGAVTEAKLAAGAVTAAKLGAEAVETAAIKNLAVTEGKLAAGAVTAAKLGAEAVETAAIKNLAVTEGKLAAGAVTAAKLGAEAVETAKIAAGAVTAAKLGAEAVETAKIKGEAVTTAKIANEAVTEGKLAAAIRKKSFREGHTFVVQGAVAATAIPGMFVPVLAGTEVKLVAVRYKLESGTVAKFRLQKNGADIAGFGTAGAPLEAKSTEAKTTEPAAVALANNDLLTVLISAVEGAPVGLACTLYVETVC